MNKQLVRLLCLAVLVTVSAFGQRGGGFHGGGAMGGGFRGGSFGMHGGFGHGFVGPGFHGSISPRFHSFHSSPFFFHTNPFFFHRSPFFFDGHNRFFFDGHNRFFFHDRFHSGPFFGFGLGFGAPSGGFYGSTIYPYPAYGSDYASPTPYTPSPNVAVVYPPTAASDYTESGAGASAQAEGSPSLVINEYNWGSSSNVQTPGKPVHCSIALTDNSTIDALAYWVEGGALHYLDTQGKEQQVPLSEVDQARSQQLNRERGVDFGLPKSG